MISQCVVIKFGGATLSDESQILACADKVISIYESGKFPVVVVSAMGDKTNQLISLISNLNQITQSYDNQSKYFKHNISSDFILSTGEMVSAGALAIALQNKKYHSQPLCGWQVPIITDDEYGNAEIKELNLEKIKELIKQNIIPVITGFQGISMRGEITTLGKGTTDLTAVFIAAKLNTDAYIYKNVNGIFTCDPNFEQGNKIDQISYENFYLASTHGAKVVCDKAVKYAKQYNVKIFVQSAFNKDNGTIISDQNSKKNMITSQEAFVINIKPNDPTPIGHAFIYEKWCLFSNYKEFYDYIKLSKKTENQEKFIKITIIHPNPINKEKFLKIANQYSEIYSEMTSYSWICVPKNKASKLKTILFEEFIK